MAKFMVSSIKNLADNPNLSCIPPSYAFQTTSPSDQGINGQDDRERCAELIPVIDYSLLISGTPEQRSKIIQDLGHACQEWGFFMVINHGVDEDLMKGMLDKCGEFFHLTEEEKMEYGDKHVLDPIRCGTSFNSSVDDILFWRDYLKVRVHPDFHSPDKPAGFSEVLEEYTGAVRGVVRGLLGGISESLGLEPCYIDRALDIDSSLQILIANLYPPCPQPELAMGLPPHSDHGLLTMLIQNGICGLQIQHQGKWVSVNAIPNAFLVNTGDHMEVTAFQLKCNDMESIAGLLFSGPTSCLHVFISRKVLIDNGRLAGFQHYQFFAITVGKFWKAYECGYELTMKFCCHFLRF